MDLALSSPLFPSNATRGVNKIKPYSSMLIATQKVSTQKLFPCLAAVATQTAQVIILDSPFVYYIFFHFLHDNWHFLDFRRWRLT